ncbi:unnamed protein product [Gordionus sp. m RMFG-2023]|uniref:endoplasmic reticulum-Golgi intermediate compartment protein 1-like n=1 Tax=Gordionus sp. m RMFG-2023 TaxID=3053472 RepID=UPI0030E38339
MGFDVKRFDIYRKIPKDLTQATYTGAVISICCTIFITYLILSELISFLTDEIVSEIYVDNPIDDEKIKVQLNMTLPNMQCEYVGLDIMDNKGRHEVGYIQNTKKYPVKRENEDGCRLELTFSINKVPGNFHISTHASQAPVENVNMQHIIHMLTFGDDFPLKGTHTHSKALVNVVKTDGDFESHDYILKLVPTIYQTKSGQTYNSYHYTQAYKKFISIGPTGPSTPAIWFNYDLNPFTVKYIEKAKPLYHFITTVCAIVGGVFTVAGLIDSFIFSTSEIFRKMELDKLT